MLYSLFVMIVDSKGSFWCGTEGKYMSSDPTSRVRAGPGEEQEEEEKSSATRFELGGPKRASSFYILARASFVCFWLLIFYSRLTL